MDALQELKTWVKPLSKGEKKNVKLLGKSRCGVTTSLHLQLFDWLNGAPPTGDPLPDPAILQHLPTVTARLKALILDSLRLQHQGENTTAKIETALGGARQLVKKRLFLPALRLLAKNKDRAWETSKYSLVIACIELEREIARIRFGPNFLAQIEALAEEEQRAMNRLATLQSLFLHYDRLRAQTMALITPRQATFSEELEQAIDQTLLVALSQSGNYLESALSINILGIHDLFRGDPLPAMHRYQRLLTVWNGHEAWQRDQAQLLYNIAIMYQRACLSAPLSVAELQTQLAWVPDFKNLQPEIAREFQSSMFLNRLALGLNTGQLDWVESIIPELDQWMGTQEDKLVPRLILAFLHNFSIVAFLNAKPAMAYSYLRRISQVPNPKVRKDIREFALVFQAFLQVELKEFTLAESLIRSGKRYFRNCGREWEFERVLFRFLEKLSKVDSQETPVELMEELSAALDTLFYENQTAIPILGLMEIRLWVAARLRNAPLRTVFLEAIQTNLEQTP